MRGLFEAPSSAKLMSFGLSQLGKRSTPPLFSLSYCALHEPRFDGRETQQLTIIVTCAELANSPRVVACVESEQFLAVVWEREDQDFVVQNHDQPWLC